MDKIGTIAGPASQFDGIAFLYDELMRGVPYAAWVDYVQRILARYECHPSSVLDLCCGTGSVGLLFAEKGCRVSFVDISPAMVALARRKTEAKGIQADFHVQDVSSLRLGRRFDLVISLFDSLNYVLDSCALQESFQNVCEHVQPGGMFIFDMNTELAFATGLFNQSNLGSRTPLLYEWRSTYDPAARICSIQMDFVYKRGGIDRQVSVTQYQRAYDEEEVEEMLTTAGLQVVAVYNAYTFRKATKRSDRVFFVARR